MDYSSAQRRLTRRDAVLKELIRNAGPCTLRTDPDGFSVLVRSIISQQISTKAAKSITARLQALLGRKRLSATNVVQLSEEDLRGAGLSAAKTRSVRELAEKTHQKAIAFKKMHDMSDEEVIAELLPLRGIGRWTAEMYLIFCLGRLDVLPCADYGLRAGVQREYELSDLPGVKELHEIAEPWKPYRSIGTWYIWRSFGAVPQS